ncbi:MAG: hypothetical protein SFX73_29730 [Kofleriaceae bacterium]|nr:hypothetical protein [Kofleriaceae bacterium]
MGAGGRQLRRIPTVAILLAVACRPNVVRAPALAFGDELTLYRDRAVVRTRVEVNVPEADQAIVTLRVPAGVDPDEVVILDHGDLTVTQALDSSAPAPPAWKRTGGDPSRAGEETDEEKPEAPATQPPTPKPGPTELRYVVTGPKAGRYGVGFGYVIDQLPWEAAYTLTTTPARLDVSVRGALAIRNTTGMTFTKARAFVVDADLGHWRRDEDDTPQLGPREGDAARAARRSLGTLTLGPGETRVELLPDAPPRKLRSVLVYDPIGTKLDQRVEGPIRDPKLGMDTRSPDVKESLEIVRPARTSEGLPGGIARLLERRPDGSLALVGEARIFDAATSIAAFDIIELGTAAGVTGQRERRDFSVDDDRKRLVEEFSVTVANTRADPVDVVLREHLYRGQNWTLAYYTSEGAKQDGAQQISMRVRVPAKGEAKLFYVVVYTWK